VPYAFTKFEPDGEVSHGHGPHVGAVLLAAPILWDKSLGLQGNPNRRDEYVRSMVNTVRMMLRTMSEDSHGLVKMYDVKSWAVSQENSRAGWVAFEVGVRTTEGTSWTHVTGFMVLAEGNGLRVRVLAT